MHKHLLSILLILVFAVILRVVGLGELPHSLQNDEASFFYNALSLFQSGADEDGRRFPLYLNSFIDPKPALFSYLQIPFIAVLGKTVFAARLVSAVLGVASLIVLYLLARRLSDNESLALAILFFGSISPWHIVLSRSTQEVILSFFFFLLTLLFAATLFLSKNTRSKQWFWFFSTCLSSLFCVYSYHSAKVLLPLFTIGLSVYAVAVMRQKIIWPLATVVLQVCFVLATTLMVSGGLSRATAVGIFSTGDTQLVLDEQIRIATASSSPLVIRFFHNKVVNYGLAFLDTYASHFTTEFLFLRGGDPTRYIVPFHGLLYIIELPLLLLGIFTSLSTAGKQKKLALLFLCWLLLAPVPSALTTEESVSMIRTSLLLVPLIFFVASGGKFVWQVARRPVFRYSLRGLLLLAYLLSFAYFIHQYTVFQPRYRPWTRQYIDQELATYLKKHHDSYTEVTISKVTGQAYVYLALQNLISLDTIQSSFPTRLQNEYVLGKFHFVDAGCFVGSNPGTLYVIGGTCVLSPQTPPFVEIADIRYFDGAEGYRLLLPGPQL